MDPDQSNPGFLKIYTVLRSVIIICDAHFGANGVDPKLYASNLLSLCAISCAILCINPDFDIVCFKDIPFRNGDRSRVFCFAVCQRRIIPVSSLLGQRIVRCIAYTFLEQADIGALGNLFFAVNKHLAGHIPQSASGL